MCNIQLELILEVKTGEPSGPRYVFNQELANYSQKTKLAKAYFLCDPRALLSRANTVSHRG